MKRLATSFYGWGIILLVYSLVMISASTPAGHRRGHPAGTAAAKHTKPAPKNPAALHKSRHQGKVALDTTLSEDFEGTFPPDGWAIGNPDADITWLQYDGASGYGIGEFSAYMDFYDDNDRGTYDSLYTPIVTGLDASHQLVFDYAYAEYNSGGFGPDSLFVALSTDGGATWPMTLFADGGSHLATAPPNGDAYVPAPSEWVTKSVSLPGEVVGADVEFAFVGRNEYGNNLFIDNVRIGFAPQVGVIYPDSLAATLTAGQTSSQTITITNVGPGILNYSVAKRIQCFTPARASWRLMNERPTATGTMKRSNETRVERLASTSGLRSDSPPVKISAPRGTLSRTKRSGRRSSTAGFNVLLLANDEECGASNLQSLLLSHPEFSSVDYYDMYLGGTPSLSDLEYYDAVVAWTGDVPYDPTGEGNVLADYVDHGGAVVLAVFALDFNDDGTNYNIGGRIMTSGYSPLLPAGGDHFEYANLVIVDSAHPILRGVSAAVDYYRDYTTLSGGAHLVAQWDDGENFVATQGSVVAVNSYIGNCSSYTGDVPLIVRNSIVFAIQQAQWLTESPISGSIASGDSAQLSVMFDATRADGGDYSGFLEISSNDPTTPFTPIPVRLHVTGMPQITASNTLVDFGTQVLGDATVPSSVTITNTGSAPLHVSGVSVSGSGFGADTSTFVLIQGLQRKINLTYSPNCPGTASGTLTLTSDDPVNGTLNVSLKANVITSFGAGTCLLLNPSYTQYVDLGSSAAFSFTGPFTVEAWIKVAAFDFDWQAIVTKGDNSWRLHRNSSTNTVGFGTTGLSNVDLGGGTDISDGFWHHVAVVYDGTNKFIYVDGNMDAEVGVTGTLALTGAPVHIGDNSEVPNRSWDGSIDEVRIWNVARTFLEIRENMHLRLHGNESGLVSYYRFDDGQGYVAHDATGGGNDGTLNDASVWSTATEPLGTGTSSSALDYTNGTIPFGTLTVSSVTPFDSPIDLTVTQITAPPNVLPAGSSTVLSDRYWVVDEFLVIDKAAPTKTSPRHGRKPLDGSANLSFTFSVPAGFTNDGSANPALYQLYNRPSTCDTGWGSAILTSADSLSYCAVSYSGIYGPGQFALGTNDPLPIQLTSLTGTTSSGGVMVQWSTVSETNNYGFYVERQKSGATSWTTVSELIPGAGTSLQQHKYSFTDASVTNGTYLYRIRQVDMNGSTHYSQSIKLVVVGVLGVGRETAPRQFALMQNYPNPFNPTTTIRFSVEKSEHAALVVFNTLGQEVQRLFDGTADPGYYYQFTVDGSKLGSGLYFYRIVTDSHHDVKKMLLLK